MKKVAWYGLVCLIVISLLSCVWNIFNVESKIRTRLDLLSIPQSGGEMSKRLGGIKGCKYKTSFMAFERVP